MNKFSIVKCVWINRELDDRDLERLTGDESDQVIGEQLDCGATVTTTDKHGTSKRGADVAKDITQEALRDE